jgi:GrpB-like predicted nucleotidyltransferase (UPF0157 family)
MAFQTPCRLVGGLATAAAPDDYRLYADLFPRLPGEVGTPGRLSRFVAYASTDPAGRLLRFLGIEVPQPRRVLPGLWGLELSPGGLNVMEPGASVVRQVPLDWHWRGADRDGRLCGEFTAALPPALGGRRRWALVGTSYVLPPRATWEDGVELADPDPAWAEHGRQAAAEVQALLGPRLARRVEHYGSTAVPGLAAKPVIDLLVEIPPFRRAKPVAVARLVGPTCEFWEYGDHFVFVQRAAPMGRRVRHLHLAPAGHPLWRGIAFRDHLRTHPDVAARYAALKRELAAAHAEDRERYTNAKRSFVEQVTAAAEAAAAAGGGQPGGGPG